MGDDSILKLAIEERPGCPLYIGQTDNKNRLKVRPPSILVALETLQSFSPSRLYTQSVILYRK
jgi:hypothetical protein